MRTIPEVTFKEKQDAGYITQSKNNTIVSRQTILDKNSNHEHHAGFKERHCDRQSRTILESFTETLSRGSNLKFKRVRITSYKEVRKFGRTKST